jgi:hypothetical protein
MSEVARIDRWGRVPSLFEANDALSRLVGAVSEALHDCGIPHRDIQLSYRFNAHGGDLTVAFETNRAEARDAAKTMLDNGVGNPGSEYYFTEITSMAKGLIWHRVSAVVVTG